MAWAKNSDLVATILFGTLVAGVATFGNGEGTPLQCLITNFEENDQVNMFDGSTLCDDDEVNDPGRGSGTISFDARVSAGTDGRTFKGKKGLPVKMTVKENGAVTTPETIYGIVENVRFTVANDALQVEAVQIRKGVRLPA